MIVCVLETYHQQLNHLRPLNENNFGINYNCDLIFIFLTDVVFFTLICF